MMAAYTINKVLRQHRRTCLIILLIPALAVIAALVLIVVLRPSKWVPVTVVIGLVLIQYLGLGYYIWRKLIARE